MKAILNNVSDLTAWIRRGFGKCLSGWGQTTDEGTLIGGRGLAYIAMALLILFGSTHANAFHNLPTICIDTPDSLPIISRDDWTEGVEVRIELPNGTTDYSTAFAQVKLRGHSTFSKPKKPFAIKLEKSASLLGMTPNKRWVLLANFMDHSNMRNRLALAAARSTTMEWTPDCRFVDVVVNGQRQGLYLLSEQVEVAKGRVSVQEGCGWLIEGDNYGDGKARLRSSTMGIPFSVKYPKLPSTKQIDEIATTIDSIESCLYGKRNGKSGRTLKEKIDLNSFADWWLIHELSQNAEPNGPRSCYIHKARNSKICMGPVWDFDLAFITVGLDEGGDLRPARLHRTDVKLLTGDSLYNANVLWYGKLLETKAFKTCLRKRWKVLKPHFETLVDTMEQWKRDIMPSAIDNERMWKGQDPARFDTFDGFQESYDNLRQTYIHRINALDSIVKRITR